MSDPGSQTSTDDIRITLVPEGGVVIDLSTIGGAREIGIGVPDTLALDPFLVVGTPENIEWTTSSSEPVLILAQILDRTSLQLIGFTEGEADVVVTATDTSTYNSSSGTIHVTVSRSVNPGELAVSQIGALTLQANRDMTIDLSALVTSGNAQAVNWTASGNDDVGVVIDDVNKLAILRPTLGFVGDAAPIVFLATSSGSDVSVPSTAGPITVLGNAGSTRGLLEISFIVNPIRKNFLDAFVISRRELLSPPIVEVQFGIGGGATTRVLQISPVEVSRIWVGDFVIDDETTGTVRISATGITSETRIALTDTAVIEIGEAGITSEFQIAHAGAEVSLPLGSVDQHTKVALFQAAAGPGEGQGLRSVSDLYVVHAASGEVVAPGQISLGINEAPDDRMGIYRKHRDGQWIYIGTRIENDRLVGTFSAFGIYGAFVDELGLTRIRQMVLHPNFPNPFNPQTQIRFDIAESGTYELTVYNILGQQVRGLIKDALSPGVYRVAWDARDDFGQPVGAGVYLYRLVSRSNALTQKMLLLK